MKLQYIIYALIAIFAFTAYSQTDSRATFATNVETAFRSLDRHQIEDVHSFTNVDHEFKQASMISVMQTVNYLKTVSKWETRIIEKTDLAPEENDWWESNHEPEFGIEILSPDIPTNMRIRFAAAKVNGEYKLIVPKRIGSKEFPPVLLKKLKKAEQNTAVDTE